MSEVQCSSARLLTPLPTAAGLSTAVEGRRVERQGQQRRQKQQDGPPGSREAAARQQLGWLQQLLHSPHDSAILAMAGPALLALAADPLLSMVDTGFVGQIGSAELVGGGEDFARGRARA